MRGLIALVGGGEWLAPARDLDAWLLERSGSKTVTILPTAAARERPDLAVATARRHFAGLGAEVEGVMILEPEDGDDAAMASRLASSPFTYLAGGNPAHLLAVLRGSAAWDAVLRANEGGGVLAGSSAGAMVLCDRTWLPRTGETVAGLGLLADLVVVPHRSTWDGGGGRVLAVDESTGLVLDGARCRILGAGAAALYREGEELWRRSAPATLEDCLR